ncbi:MAG TPA: ATP-binding protein [Phenylobacterium sp.]|nr:ATP-binding protein [Phenylobacterium sp.]
MRSARLNWPALRDLEGWRRYAAAFGTVVVSTLVSELLYRSLDTTRLSMVFLAGVVVAAVWLGSGPAYFAALTAYGIYNFYLVDPRFTIQFVTAEDFIVLTVFLIVAMLTGGLAGRVRDAARRAQSRAQATNALLAASREFTSLVSEQAVQERPAAHLATVARGEAMISTGGAAVLHPPGITPPAQTPAGDAAPSEEAWVAAGWRTRLLRADGEVLGVAAWRPATTESAPSDDQTQLVHVLVDLGATALVRARLSEAQTEIETLARTERLRNALLSSISHDLRTPLASILASATSLKDFGERFDSAVRADLLDTIQEEAERMNRFIANLLNMTKLESGALRVEPAPFDVAEVADQALARLSSRLAGRKVTRRLPARPAVALGDSILLEQALSNVLENALRYTPETTGLSVEIEAEHEVVITIADQGHGVPPQDLERIFEKFYRGGAAESLQQGAGLGLSITRGLVEAMGGSAQARLPQTGGLEVEIRLPAATEALT